nr:immunoglobulin heavy chain junction region [Mus musculus]NSM04907.1 immunoglobulin heavy chain junction region [Mus musculus]NSM07539.1 immunoglobulin heavy chain junction region [Mus musculus]
CAIYCTVIEGGGYWNYFDYW